MSLCAIHARSRQQTAEQLGCLLTLLCHANCIDSGIRVSEDCTGMKLHGTGQVSFDLSQSSLKGTDGQSITH